MKRLISGAEAVQSGIFPAMVDYGRTWMWRATPAIEPTPNRDAYRLWRSLPGYRKACRMLRRGGRRIRCGFERRAWAKGEATPFRGMDPLPGVLDDPAAKAFAESSVYDLGALRRQLDDGMLD